MKRVVNPVACRQAATLLLIGMLWLPAPAAAEASWGDLFPLLGKVALLGVPLLIVQVCHGLWPLMVGLAALSWAIRAVVIRMGWDVRPDVDDDRRRTLLFLLLRPQVVTALAVVMVVVAAVASVTLDPAHLRDNRYSVQRLWRVFSPVPRPPPREPVVPFTLPEIRRWPTVPTEFAPAAALPAEYAGTYALEIENRAGEGAVYARLCDAELPRCLAVRTMFIPKGASITLNALASRAYRLHYRPVADQRYAGTSVRFELPGTRSLYGVSAGKGDPRDNPYLSRGSFEYGDERQAALLRLPRSAVTLQGSNVPLGSGAIREVFLRLRPEEF